MPHVPGELVLVETFWQFLCVVCLVEHCLALLTCFWRYLLQYTTLLQQIFSYVPASAVHSVSVGALRFPDKMLKKIVQHYPNDKILHQVAVNQQGEHAYATEREAYMLSFVRGQVMAHIPEDKIFKCY